MLSRNRPRHAASTMTTPARPQIGFGVDCEIRAGPGAMPGIFSLEVAASPASPEIMQDRCQRQRLQRVARLISQLTPRQFVALLHANEVLERCFELLHGEVAYRRIVHDFIEAPVRMNTSRTDHHLTDKLRLSKVLAIALEYLLFLHSLDGEVVMKTSA